MRDVGSVVVRETEIKEREREREESRNNRDFPSFLPFFLLRTHGNEFDEEERGKNVEVARGPAPVRQSRRSSYSKETTIRRREERDEIHIQVYLYMCEYVYIYIYTGGSTRKRERERERERQRERVRN